MTKRTSAWRTRTLVVLTLLLLARPGPAAGRPQQPGDTFRPEPSFPLLYSLAARAYSAYGTPEQIRTRYGEDTLVRHLPGVDVQYFVTFHPEHRLQVVSIRGTASWRDVLDDADLVQQIDHLTGVVVHAGFDRATDALWADLQDSLRRDYRTRITGHSLGGAIAAVLMMHLLADDYTLDQVVTFGQPKVTDAAGAARYADAPVMRVVDEHDVVHFLPPETLVGESHGRYEHIGPEVVLLDGIDYLFHDEHRSDSLLAESFWTNLLHESASDHHIAHYIDRLRPKVAGAAKVR